MAGIHVSPKEEAETENATEGAQIKNRIAYNLAVVYKKSRDDRTGSETFIRRFGRGQRKANCSASFPNPQPRDYQQFDIYEQDLL